MKEVKELVLFQCSAVGILYASTKCISSMSNPTYDELTVGGASLQDDFLRDFMSAVRQRVEPLLRQIEIHCTDFFSFFLFFSLLSSPLLSFPRVFMISLLT